MQLVVGLVLAAAISYGAWRAGSLAENGAWAATGVGAIVFGLGGWQWALLLLLFFVSSSLFSQRLPGHGDDSEGKSAKGARRDAGQVLGNASVAVVCVALHAALADNTWPWFAYAASLAAVTADTWSTELGGLSPVEPRLITHLHRAVTRGTSGGVTVLGLVAAMGGAGLIGASAALLLPMPVGNAAAIILLGGTVAAVFDSLLGATVQCVYVCPKENVETEQYPLHRCGTPTVYGRGWRWLNNDWVNASCSAVGPLASCALALVLTAA